jgi:dipeptidyl aminopeptidase/acylaminoacyl peptidase
VSERRDRYSPEMAVDLRYPMQPRLSPDGAQVAFSVNPIGHRDKHQTSTIFIVPSDGATPPRSITDSAHNNVAPRWSPDGSKLAFLSDRPERGTAQLHIVPVAGGEPLGLTRLDGGVSEPAWLPDGRALAFTARRRALAGEPEPKAEFKVASEKPRPRGIAVVPLTGGPATPIGPRDGHVATFAISPDGVRIAAIVTPTDLLDSGWDAARLIVTRFDGMVERELLRFSGFPNKPVWSPDGRQLAVIGSRLPNHDDTNVYIVDIFSGEVTVIDDGGMTPNWVAFDGDDLLVQRVRTQWTQIDRTDPRGDEWDRLAFGPDVDSGWIESGLNIDTVAGALVFTCAHFNRPPDVYAAPAGADAVRLTDLNPQLDQIEFSVMEPLEWQANDGTTVHGWLLLPPGTTEPSGLPLITEIHGGPSAQWGNWFFGTWHDWAQLLAAAGYAVLLPNPRGSTGRGGGFTNANRFDFGGGDFDDIMTGIDLLVERGIADPERLGVCGWSYGGFMTAWAVTHTDRFKAAVAGAAPTNWISKIGTTDIRPFNEWNLGEVNVDPDRVWERSPIRYVASVTTPTLLVHGEADVRVPVTQGTEFYLALRALGVATDMISYPRQGHAFTERAFELDLLQRLIGWFDRYLRGDE